MKKRNPTIKVCLLLMSTSLILCGCKGQSLVTEDGGFKTNVNLVQEENENRIDTIVTPKGERQQVILSTFSEIRSGVQSVGISTTEKLVQAFNAQSDDYEIVMTVGADEGMDFNTYYTRLNTELIAGKGPDLFVANTHASFPDMVEKGVMEDLKPYIARDLEESEYLKEILYAFEKDGKVYALEYMFTLYPYLTDKKLVGDKISWKYEDILQILQNHPEITSFNGSSAMNVLAECCSYWGWQPSDMEKLREYIEFAKKYGVELEYDKQIPGKTILVTTLSLGQTDSLNVYEQRQNPYGRSKYDEKYLRYQYMPAPGSGAKVLQEGVAFSMNSASEVKEGVWSFLKFILSDECQQKISVYGMSEESESYLYGGFPVRKKQFDEMFRKAAEPVEVSGDYKQFAGYREEDKLNYLGNLCMTDEEIEQMKSLVEKSTVWVWANPGKALEIVEEEAEDYFENKKSLDEVMQLIENRMGLYLSE